MGRTVYYTATTLDGFIADTHDSLDWLFVQDLDADGPMNYATFIADVGALVMGATTYEWIRARIAAGSEKWAYPMPTAVFAHRDLPVIDGADVRFVRGDVGGVHTELAAAAPGSLPPTASTSTRRTTCGCPGIRTGRARSRR